MEDLIREAREIKERVRAMLLTYQYREKILSGEDRDIPADKLYNAVVCLSNFASIVEREKPETEVADDSRGCPNCGEHDTIRIQNGFVTIGCDWCGWTKHLITDTIVDFGDPAKKRSVVESETKLLDPTLCPNCKHPNAVTQRPSQEGTILCVFCGWTKDVYSSAIIYGGDQNKRMP